MPRSVIPAAAERPRAKTPGAVLRDGNNLGTALHVTSQPPRWKVKPRGRIVLFQPRVGLWHRCHWQVQGSDIVNIAKMDMDFCVCLDRRGFRRFAIGLDTGSPRMRKLMRVLRFHARGVCGTTGSARRVSR